MNNICDTIIHAEIIITQNESREILRDASLAIKDGVIVDLDATDNINKSWQAKQILDYSHDLLMPGLINAHTHAAMTFLRGLGDDRPLMSWLNENIFPLEAKLTQEIVFLGSMLGYAEMLASGTTACIDMYIFEEAVFQAAQATGIRCMGGEAIFEFPSAACPDYRAALDKTKYLAEKFRGNERIKIAVNPHGVYTTTPKILKDSLELALQENLPIHIHLAETQTETTICKDKYGMRPVAWCEENGLFQARVIAAHLVDLEEDEIDFLAKTNTTAVHNPASNMKLASGIASLGRMRARNMTTALGTDGPASNNSLNMFSEMKLAALLQKVSSGDPTALPAASVLDMATIHGATAFGDPQLGSLAKGRKADCIILDLKAPNLFPTHNPVSQVIYSASGLECKLTMTEGQILYREKRYLSFDYDALLIELDKLRKFIIENCQAARINSPAK